ncbi:MAG: L-threonylcarbamoyladenylate synthase [Candidatus Thermoplasmatota archaeon]|nr:L-threonylcarbamoyladenylate synthase [Candidatus Thermoplasmatota archaeon]
MLKLKKSNRMLEVDLKAVVKALKDGNVVVYPTDTLYGLGADIFNKGAVSKVFSIKKRSLDVPISVAVSNLKEIENIAHVTKKARKLCSKFLPGKLTIILKKKENVPDIVTSKLGKIAIRIPDNEIALKLLSEFGPLTATSANIHGAATPCIINDIKMQFCKDDVSVYIDAGRIDGRPSTIVDVSSDEMRIVREGMIPKERILEVI